MHKVLFFLGWKRLPSRFNFLILAFEWVDRARAVGGREKKKCLSISPIYHASFAPKLDVLSSISRERGEECLSPRWIRFFPSSGLNPRFEFVAASRSVVSLAKKRVRIGTYGERPNLAENVYFSRTRKSSYPLEGDVNRVGKPLKPSSKFFSSLSQFFALHLSRIKKAKEIRRKAPNLLRFKILEYKI